MFIKIIKKYDDGECHIHLYDCKRFSIVPVELKISDKKAERRLSVWINHGLKDAKEILVDELDSSVFILNNDGKTIDRPVIRTNKPDPKTKN